MGKDRLSRMVSFLLAGLLTIVMVYATVVLPVKLHSLLSSVSIWHILNRVSLGIRVVAFCLLIALVVAGFVLEKTRWASLGSFFFYLPTLSYYVTYMWYLYGIGILFVLWGPLAPIFPFVGELVYLPYLVVGPLLRDLSWLLGTEIGLMGLYGITYFLLGGGSFVFLLGTEAWLYGQKTGKGVIDFGMYQYSRHPQYLGFILWSYGSSFVGGPVFPPAQIVKGYLNPGFPWVVSVLLVVCVAMFEEQTMVEQYGQAYRTYRKEAPFLLPLPSSLATLVTKPIRLLLGKNYPTKKREIAYIFILYLSLYLLTAFLFYSFLHAFLGLPPLSLFP